MMTWQICATVGIIFFVTVKGDGHFQPYHNHDSHSGSFQPNQNYDSYSYPAGCISDCEYKASWRYVSFNDSMDFTVMAKVSPEVWTGIGFSDVNNMMPESDGYTGYLSRTTFPQMLIFKDRYLFAKRPSDVPVDHIQNAGVKSYRYADGYLTYTFNRARDTGDDRDVSLKKCVYILYAWGGQGVGEESITAHTKQFVSSQRVCFGQSPSQAQPPPPSPDSTFSDPRNPGPSPDSYPGNPGQPPSQAQPPPPSPDHAFSDPRNPGLSPDPYPGNPGQPPSQAQPPPPSPDSTFSDPRNPGLPPDPYPGNPDRTFSDPRNPGLSPDPNPWNPDRTFNDPRGPGPRPNSYPSYPGAGSCYYLNCGPNARCERHFGAAHCKCYPNYRRVSGRCIRQQSYHDPCSLRYCGPHAYCQRRPFGRSVCICYNGYYGSSGSCVRRQFFPSFIGR